MDVADAGDGEQEDAWVCFKEQEEATEDKEGGSAKEQLLSCHLSLGPTSCLLGTIPGLRLI